jgi:hypothetical protein
MLESYQFGIEDSGGLSFLLYLLVFVSFMWFFLLGTNFIIRKIFKKLL